MFILRNIEEILASIAISITVLVVIVNVVLRYGFNFVVPWSEELSVICFIWSVYLGISSCYKHKLHMGVDVMVAMLPAKVKPVFRLCVFCFFIGVEYSYGGAELSVFDAIKQSDASHGYVLLCH